MAARLHMTQTQLNIIAVGPGSMHHLPLVIQFIYPTLVAGDFIGPVWGRIVDSRGPRIALVTASITLFAGYAGIKCIYDRGIGSDTLVPLITLLLVIFSHMLVGFGSCAGGAAAINMTAKRFPESAVRFSHLRQERRPLQTGPRSWLVQGMNSRFPSVVPPHLWWRLVLDSLLFVIQHSLAPSSQGIRLRCY